MKKLLLIACLYSVFPALAQLSGTYTIGGTTPDYASFAEAVTALSTSGISAPVTFNVRNGMYSESIIIPAIAGTSDVNRIIFQSESGDSSTVILTSASSTSMTNNYTLFLRGAHHITFNHLTISRTGVEPYATVVSIGDSTSNLLFSNNYIVGTETSDYSTLRSLIFSGSSSLDIKNRFINNLFENGSYGMYYQGPAGNKENGTVISGNIFKDQYSANLDLWNQDSVVINQNEMTSKSAYTVFYNIYLSTCDNSVITKNKLSFSTATGTGLELYNCDAPTTTPTNVSNNFIYAGGLNGLSYGIRISGCANLNIIHNSVNVANKDSAYCIFAQGTGTQKLVMKNNIFANTSEGNTLHITSGAVNGISQSENNNLYTTGLYLAFWDTLEVADLTEWKTVTGLDAHSVSADPVFVSPFDLHSNSPVLDNAGSFVADVTTDIDGELRSTTTPDIGADEFTYIPVGINTLSSDNQIRIYPNPAQQILNVKLPRQFQENVVIRLMDVNGRTVSEKVNATFDTKIKLESLENGIYFIQVTGSTETKTMKVIVQQD